MITAPASSTLAERKRVLGPSTSARNVTVRMLRPSGRPLAGPVGFQLGPRPPVARPVRHLKPLAVRNDEAADDQISDGAATDTWRPTVEEPVLLAFVERAILETALPRPELPIVESPDRCVPSLAAITRGVEPRRQRGCAGHDRRRVVYRIRRTVGRARYRLDRLGKTQSIAQARHVVFPAGVVTDGESV